MELSFENHYVVGITIFMLAMLFCGKLIKLLTTMVDGLEKCLLAFFQMCSCPCLHYEQREVARVMFLAFLYGFSIGQPFVLLLLRYIFSSAGNEKLWTVNFVETYYNHTAFSHKHNASIHTASQHPTSLSISVTEADALFLIMPYALASAVSTWTWLSLHHAGFFSNDPCWDMELFRDIRMQIYELTYVFQQFVVVYAFSALTSEPVNLWYVACFAATCTLLACYLIACSRAPLDTEGINMPILVFALLCTTLSVFATHYWSDCWFQRFNAIILIMWGLQVGFLHLSSRGEFTAGMVILSRTVFACAYSLYFMFGLAIGANKFCI